MRRFPILLWLAALAAGTLFMVRTATLRQLNAERRGIEQQTSQWSNPHLAMPSPEVPNSISTNRGLSALEHSRLLQLRGEISRLCRDLAEETNRIAALTGPELVRSTAGVLSGPPDVTAVVKALLAGGTNSIAAGNHMFGEDPSPGIVKRLRIEFDLGGQHLTNETTEGGSLEIPAGAQLVRAAYGDFPALDPAKEIMDVTAEVSALVANGQATVKAANALVGFDPAPMIGKLLRVELQVDGAPLLIEAREGTTLDIPAGATIIRATYGNLRGQKRDTPDAGASATEPALNR